MFNKNIDFDIEGEKAVLRFLSLRQLKVFTELSKTDEEAGTLFLVASSLVDPVLNEEQLLDLPRVVIQRLLAKIIEINTIQPEKKS